MRTDHVIFHEPFPVEFEWEEVDTPSNYSHYPDDEGLTPKIKVWKVHEDLGTGVVGLVADGYRFDDSPDAEWISSGLNSKNQHAAAIARQGNWFLWGFQARPDQMTESGRRAFLNSVVYASHFDGKPALHATVSSPRDWAIAYASFGRQRGDARNALLASFDEGVLEHYDANPDGFEAFLRDNLDYLYRRNVERTVTRPDGSTSTFERALVYLDDDARTLAIPNHDPRILDRCIADLAGDDADAKARALRILRRYTDQDHGDDAAAWGAWLAGVRDRIYFSDSFGYRFFADEPGKASPGSAREWRAEPGDSPGSVAVRMAATDDRLEVRFAIPAGWHLYPPGSDEGLPIAVEVLDGSAFRAAGAPKVEPVVDGHVEGEATLTLPLERTRPGTALRVAITWQACDLQVCLPPHTVTLGED